MVQKVIYSFFPKAALRAGHNSVLGFVQEESLQGKWGHKEIQFYSYNSLSGKKPSMGHKKPQTQQNLGD